MRISLTVIAAGLTLSTAAAAQDNEAADRQKALEQCVSLESDAARLACFDAVMSGQSEVQEEIKQAREQETRDNFGLTETDVRQRSGKPEPEPDIAITSTVSAVRKEAGGRFTFVLANGQIWRTTNAGNMRYQLRVGDRLTLKEGMIGGYRATVEGRTGLLGVERIR